MPCTFIGWAHHSCTGVGKGNFTAAEKESPAVIKKYGGYGVDADGDGKASMWSLPDAIMSAAKYLASIGNYSWDNTESVKKAIRKYNHSDVYVNDVLTKAIEFQKGATLLTDASVTNNGPASSYGFIAPTTGIMTSSWGKRYLKTGVDIHRAMDIGENYKRKILAVADGTVTRTNSSCGWGSLGNKCGGGWGNYVRITHTINGKQFETIYAHMITVLAKPGPVSQGQVIGLVGSSGSSTGPHLHFELHSPYRAGDDGEIYALNPILYLPPIPKN